MADETVNPLIGDPEAQGQANASSAISPVVQAYISGTPDRVLNGLAALTPHYDPSLGLAGNALNPTSLEAAQNLALGFAGGAIKGYHGTPHQFEPVEGNPFGEFRNEAIGSGEGAQAYGWGHYVAGNPKVAESYKKAGSPIDFYFDNEPFHSDDLEQFSPEESIGISTWLRSGGDLKKAEQLVESDSKNVPRDWPDRQEEIDSYTNGLNWLKQNVHRLQEPDPGSLLEVHILPEEHELLDWDKPLSEQSPGVQEKIRAMGYSWPIEGEILRKKQLVKESYIPTGEETYYNLAWKHMPDDDRVNTIGHELASAALHQAGIPGIKYLDAGSRASGEGTHNYVIFDPSNLRIVARNGQRLEPVDSNPFEEPK